MNLDVALVLPDIISHRVEFNDYKIIFLINFVQKTVLFNYYLKEDLFIN